MYRIPTHKWFIQGNDGINHQLELSFDSPFKNVALKLDEELIFDIKLREYETVYPLRLSSASYMLVLRKKPVGAFECELRDENDQNIPCISDRPEGFGKPKKRTLISFLFELLSILIVAGTLGSVLFLIFRAFRLMAQIE